MKELIKILYAEDEPDVQTIVSLAIETTSNYQLKICENGRKLLECVDEYSPDLILLDVMMPEMDGPTTFGKLQSDENTKKIPVIFVTAKAQIHEVEKFKGMGSLGVITKPFKILELCDEIQRIWDENNG